MEKKEDNNKTARKARPKNICALPLPLTTERDGQQKVFPF
jgi:hypothetical protein